MNNPASNYPNLSVSLVEINNHQCWNGTVANLINFLLNGGEENYNKMVEVLINGTNEQIMLHPDLDFINLADGTVMFDSGKAKLMKVDLFVDLVKILGKINQVNQLMKIIIVDLKFISFIKWCWTI